MNLAAVVVALSVLSCSLALPGGVFPAPVDRAEDIVTSGTWELADPTDPIIAETEVDGVWLKEAYYTLYHYGAEDADYFEVDLTLDGPTYLSGFATIYSEQGDFDGEAAVVLPLPIGQLQVQPRLLWCNNNPLRVALCNQRSYLQWKRHLGSTYQAQK